MDKERRDRLKLLVDEQKRLVVKKSDRAERSLDRYLREVTRKAA